MKIFKYGFKNIVIKNNKKNIKYGKLDLGIPDIKPSKFFVPDWYKDIETYNIKSPVFLENGLFKHNIKNCMPFLDSLVSGYSIELPCDIYIENKEDFSYVRWAGDFDIVEHRKNKDQNPIPTPIGCSSEQFAWNLPHSIETPKGYSLIFTHPFNRFDLPFVTLTGIIDSDDGIHGGNIPFFIDKSFNGLLKAGTPIIQIIPLKRENWSMLYDDNHFDIMFQRSKSFRRRFVNAYKEISWKRKSYE